MRVVIAEKPSVARDIAKVIGANNKKDGYIEGNNYIVTWCIGHLVGLAVPSSYDEKYKKWNLNDLPIIPEQFKYEVLENDKKQYNIIKELINKSNVTEVIFAADAGREGELINRLVYNQAKCTKPVKRLWISSMTNEAIRKGFENLKNGSEYDNLYKSAECRAIADWLIGINASRKYSIAYSKLTLGRVQTPTLAMIVQRQHEIDNFKPSLYYEIIANYKEFSGKFINKENDCKIDSIEIAEQILKETRGFNGIIENIEKKNKKLNPPLLYDLTELQREANKRFGYSAQQTLDVAQSLYEKHKATTYPRTDSRYLSDDMKTTFLDILSAIGHNYYQDKILDIMHKLMDIKAENYKNRCINNSKISDHHAIIPTNKKVNLQDLNNEELNIYKLICTRFIVQFLHSYEYEETIIKVKISKHAFISKGNTIMNLGWKALEANNYEIDASEKDDNITLPLVSIGNMIDVIDFNRIDKKTTPRKQFTEATLLSAMESAGQYVENDDLREQLKDKGIGTPATRASIIEKIIKEEYVIRKGKSLVPTQKGMDLISIAPLELISPELTGAWEQKLNKIAKGDLDSKLFLDEIKLLTKKIICIEKANDLEFKNENNSKEKELIGICPRCSKNVYEGDKNYYCEGYKTEPKCTFVLWKNNKLFGKITKTQAKKLIKGDKVLFKKLKNKTGKEYDAYLRLEDTGIYINLVFDSYNKS